MAFNFGGSGQTQSSFGFGASSQATSSFGFGSSQPQSQSLFGSAPQSQSLFGQQQSQSLFGQPQSQSLFGQSSQSLFGQSSQSLFGQSSQSLFGQSQSTLFGQPQSSGSLFGAQSQSIWGQSSSAFGGSSMFGASQPQIAQQQQQQQHLRLPRTLTAVIERLNPLHPESKFHTSLYNRVAPGDISRYKRPSNMDEKLWDEAVGKNPDPSRLIPVQANLFDDLIQRSNMQTKRVEEHLIVLSKIEQLIKNIDGQVDTEISAKLAAYRRRHRELARKLLRIASIVELEASNIDSSGVLTPTESERKKRLDTIARALAAPAEFKDKLSDLVEIAESTVLNRQTQPAVEIRDPKAANTIKQLLSDQLQGIQHLSHVCERADRDITIMSTALER
ncbi:Nucleoporin complex subunit 54 [Gracilaria domingensis]|nr:Nucleoporin complex subunit 54 [Gracilaria domingensis]